MYSRAAKTLRGLDWFEAQSVRGQLKDGQVAAGEAGERNPRGET
ncbi:dodecin domain-containing protein [Mycobacterium sp. AT1]